MQDNAVETKKAPFRRLSSTPFNLVVRCETLIEIVVH